ncbi:MAG TPA: hypothetical protein PKM51_00370 [Chitinophagales bacterium]|nr:hypothetical protein [Chitinophagales bacterium]HNM31173.1 hypothetical protein [Chitinophagales bacterium]
MSKQKLIILSDLWGVQNAPWMKYYTTVLSNSFDITVYDSCALGYVDTSSNEEKTIHQQFLTFGINNAVENLLKKEQSPVHILGFSVGGYIAWKAVSKGLPASYLSAVSSTRLRLESSKPPVSKIEVFFAENDRYKPDDAWFDLIQIEKNIFKNEEHNCYKNKSIATIVCNKIMQL